jgi:hypothetical protein
MMQGMHKPRRPRGSAPKDLTLRPLEEHLESISGRVIEDQSVVAEHQGLWQVREAADVAATHAKLRHGMPTLGDPRADTREMPAQTAQTDVEQVDSKACRMRTLHGLQSSVACQGRFQDRQASIVDERLRPGEDTPAGGDSGAECIDGIQLASQCVRIKDRDAGRRELQSGQRGLARANRTCDDGEDRR